jgi:hypothetical protein
MTCEINLEHFLCVSKATVIHKICRVCTVFKELNSEEMLNGTPVFVSQYLHCVFFGWPMRFILVVPLVRVINAIRTHFQHG